MLILHMEQLKAQGTEAEGYIATILIELCLSPNAYLPCFTVFSDTHKDRFVSDQSKKNIPGGEPRELGLVFSTALNRWYNFRQVSQPFRFHVFSSVCNIRMAILNLDENISNQRV